MAKVFDSLSSLVDTDTTVLIQGESGTGKELIARALHFYGNRRDKSFLALNCSAIPEQLLESELFGYVKGAFTGAVQTHMGKFELANGGTLFLDEIGELSPSIQVKLLRVLEDREFQRLGDNKSIKIDVRLITATNTNLYKRVLEGSFRADLYYRLSVFPLDLPPLRERVEDIRLLVNHFVEKFNRQMGRKIRGVAANVTDILESHPWPGNVRELRNAIEHAFVHCNGDIIRPWDLPQKILESPQTLVAKGSSNLIDTLESVEREVILNALVATNWNKTIAAKRLGISLSTLWRRMQKYEVERSPVNSENTVSNLNISGEPCYIN
jgi:transcriptional regulator with GAF, ATPase, and Fis domain